MSHLDIHNIIFERFRPVFQAYDKDGNSTLEPAEFRSLLAENLCIPVEDVTEEQLDWHYKRIDTQNKGHITFQEYVRNVLISVHSLFRR